MITSIVVAYAKYSLLLAKALLVVVAFISSPRLSTQAGHGAAESHATAAPAGAGHGAKDTHATATPAPAHATDPHATPAAAGHGDAAHGDAAHGDAAHGTAAHGEPAHDSSHEKAGAHGDSHAAAGHGDAHGPAPLLGPTMWGLPLGVWHALNFVILFGAIFWFTRRALVASVRAKRDATAKNIEEATRLRDEMRKKFEDYDARMRNIDERMTSIVTEAKTESEAEMAKMVAEAGVVGNRIREDAKLIADQEIARAKRELQDEQIARAAELAEQILKANITKEDQARLADEFMARVGTTKEGRA